MQQKKPPFFIPTLVGIESSSALAGDGKATEGQGEGRGKHAGKRISGEAICAGGRAGEGKREGVAFSLRSGSVGPSGAHLFPVWSRDVGLCADELGMELLPRPEGLPGRGAKLGRDGHSAFRTQTRGCRTRLLVLLR